MTEPAHFATQQHIQLIAAKRIKLEQAQLAAEEQFCMALAREFNAGRIGYTELADAYADLRGDESAPRFLAGFPSRRWRPVLPDIKHVKAMVKWQSEASFDDWHGEWPLDHQDVPPYGLSVVYVLFDSNTRPCYVGSTQAFRTRMAQHAGSGKRWSRWQAYKCRDRQHAYEVETRFLEKYMPQLNKRR